MVDVERPTGLEVSREVAECATNRRKFGTIAAGPLGRTRCAGRANFSPFLREAAAALPELVATFIEHGSAEAAGRALGANADNVESELRQRRAGVALTVALGDLSGEFGFVEATRLLSDFADAAIEQALEAALTERIPGAESRASPFSRWASSAAASSIIRPTSTFWSCSIPTAMPRRERDDPSEAAVRVGRRMIELLQKRTADGYVVRVDLRLRPSPEVTPIVLPINAAISHYESSALPWERAAFIRARACAGDRALGEHFLQSIQPFVWRRSLDFGVIEEIREISARIRDHFAQGARLGPGYDLKRGRGGIREVEFFAQIQQMIHGGRDPSVRAPATLDALEALRAAGRIARCEALRV